MQPMLRSTLLRPILRPQPIRIARRNLFRSRAKNPIRAVEHLNINELHQRRRDYDRDRTYFLLAGAVAGMLGIVVTSYKLYKAVQAKQIKDSREAKEEKQEGKEVKKSNHISLQSDTPTATYTTDGDTKRKVVIHDEEGRELVPTGNATVPSFPRTIQLATPGTSQPGSGIASIEDNIGTEYTLVGLGTRTVSILGIQVYVVGFYVATSDVANLQAYLVKKINPIATTLVPSEQNALRNSLLDPVEGEQTWDTVLRESGCRSAFRIIPVRDTDMHHLRDGFVRAITGRSQRDTKMYGDEQFGTAVRDFKTIFDRGRVPKRKELVLLRDGNGRMAVLYHDGKKREVLGEVGEERVSRLLWLNYLAGKKVASEATRQSIIAGIMEFVERPVGTVATQVV